MGLTNIHHAGQVLQHAGSNNAVQAAIGYLNKGVLLIGREFVQEEVDTFETFLHFPYRDRWINYNGHDAPTVTAADANCPIPSLYTSPGLREAGEISPLMEEATSDLAFVIVVRGRSAALYSKVRIFYSRSALAAGILEEAVQGHSVAFSAVMLKQDITRLSDDLRFRKVKKLSDLRSDADEKERTSIPLCC